MFSLDSSEGSCWITLIVLQANTARLIFSWNDNDPAMQDGSDAMRHTTRGAASVNLLGGLPDPPPEPRDSETFFIGVNSVSSDIPAQNNMHFYTHQNT